MIQRSLSVPLGPIDTKSREVKYYMRGPDSSYSTNGSPKYFDNMLYNPWQYVSTLVSKSKRNWIIRNTKLNHFFFESPQVLRLKLQTTWSLHACDSETLIILLLLFLKSQIYSIWKHIYDPYINLQRIMFILNVDMYRYIVTWDVIIFW